MITTYFLLLILLGAATANLIVTYHYLPLCAPAGTQIGPFICQENDKCISLGEYTLLQIINWSFTRS